MNFSYLLVVVSTDLHFQSVPGVHRFNGFRRSLLNIDPQHRLGAERMPTTGIETKQNY
jgi:hypothetical protein